MIRLRSSKVVVVGKSAMALRRAAQDSLRGNSRAIKLNSASKKIFVMRVLLIRTANRHRWIGRVYRDERENYGQGTRQYSWTYLRKMSSSRLNVRRSESHQATVYQKHRSVLSRKMMYTGWHLPSARRLNIGCVKAPDISPGERQQ